jgi:hypothetical protein
MFENQQHGTVGEIYDLTAFAYMMALREAYSPSQPEHTDLSFDVRLRAGKQEASQVDTSTHIYNIHNVTSVYGMDTYNVFLSPDSFKTYETHHLSSMVSTLA